eukprot:1161546-Pelagomonas_calceolata.AAC.1
MGKLPMLLLKNVTLIDPYTMNVQHWALDNKWQDSLGGVRCQKSRWSSVHHSSGLCVWALSLPAGFGEGAKLMIPGIAIAAENETWGQAQIT